MACNQCGNIPSRPLYRLYRVQARTSDGFVEKHAVRFVSIVNSYLGYMVHFSSYNQRAKVISMIGQEWWRVMYIAGHYEKAVVKQRYRPENQLLNGLKHGAGK